MQTCSKCQALSPDTIDHCQNCGADLREWSITAVSLVKIQANPRVNYVRILVAGDACPACQRVEGAYTKDAAPRIPIEGCSHGLGCRCYYQPSLEEIYP